MTASEQLQALLVGKHYWRFTVGSTFDLDFDGFILTAQEFLSPDEKLINDTFVKAYPAAAGTSDRQNVAKSGILAACLRREVTSVETRSDALLIIRFENGVEMHFPTTTRFVDWHWAISEDGRDPYLGGMFACFAPGEIQSDIGALRDG